MKFGHTRLLALVLSAALLLGLPSAASAATFNDKYSGSDFVTRSTTLNFAKPHKDFKLRVWVKTNGAFVSKKYSITMYDRNGRRLWSAAGQGDRTYGVGKNVTRIVLKREAAQGATTRWEKR